MTLNRRTLLHKLDELMPSERVRRIYRMRDLVGLAKVVARLRRDRENVERHGRIEASGYPQLRRANDSDEN